MRFDPGVAWQVVDGEVVILDVPSGRAMGLNGLGSFVWQRLERESLPEIAAAVALEFDVAESRALEDVERFVMSLQAQRLLSVE